MMRILIYCRYYLPIVGGLPIRMRIMAEQFTAAGHSVTVVTDTPGEDDRDESVTTLRGLGVWGLRRIAARHDILMSANVSLKAVPILLSTGRPVFVAHGGGYFAQGWLSGLSRAKLILCGMVNNIYCSRAVAGWIGAPGVVLPNTYRADIFHEQRNAVPAGDIVSFGRLVSDKGFATAIDAIARLEEMGHQRTLKIIGDGPELAALRALSEKLGVARLVSFTGELTGTALAGELARHRVAVLPSLWEEPFGNVALEASGCGCIVIVSDGGGLPEAAGPCGHIFARGDAPALADAILRTDDVDTNDPAYQALRSAHLERYRPDRVAEAYLTEFRRILAGTRISTPAVATGVSPP